MLVAWHSPRNYYVCIHKLNAIKVYTNNKTTTTQQQLNLQLRSRNDDVNRLVLNERDNMMKHDDTCPSPCTKYKKNANNLHDNQIRNSDYVGSPAQPCHSHHAAALVTFKINTTTTCIIIFCGLVWYSTFGHRLMHTFTLVAECARSIQITIWANIR